MDKKKIIFVTIIVMVVLLSLGIIIFTDNEEKPNNNQSNGSSFVENNGNAPSKVETNEKDVEGSLANELYQFIPKMYQEEIAPFTSTFMMNAAIDQIMQENQDLRTKNVDERVKEIFGKDAKIDKEEVSVPDVSKSIYYYSKEAESYAIIPVGYGGIFELQIFKNATETKDAYYVYTYALGGIYYYEDESLVEDETDDNFDDEFTDEEVGVNENTKVRVIVGDKEGYDLVHVFENDQVMYDENEWIKNYENKMPVFRYTLKKDGKSYYLIEVEQLSY